jgi:TonB family protein
VLADEAKRFTAINAYWTSALPAPYWRKYWNDFYTANQEPVASPDPLLLSIEARMRAALERDDFQRAADESQMLPPVLGEALNRAAGNLIESHVDKATFVARRTPCLPGASPNRASGKPRLLPTAELESFYPPRSKRFGVHGTVVLRVKVDRAGCGKQVAIVVGSGVPELDEAALDWFETAQFSAAWQAGGTVQSKMMFKIRFKIEEPISHQSRG